MIKAIAFDFGGTLFSTTAMGKFTPELREFFISCLARRAPCSVDEAMRAYEAYIDSWQLRRGRSGSLPETELSSADLLRHALEAVNLPLTPSTLVAFLNEFHAREAEGFRPLVGVVETLPLLAASGCRLCVVSNNPWTEAIRASFRRHGVEELFDSIVVSCDVGFRKPHAPIFELLLRRLELPAAAVLFVGDSFTHDIETPKALGFKTCLVDFEGLNRNGQAERAREADVFLTRFEDLVGLLAPSAPIAHCG